MSPGPDPRDVAELTRLLGLMRDFPSDEQRARYLLTSNWMRERGAEAARVNAEQLAAVQTASPAGGNDAYVACAGHLFTCTACGVKGCCHECEDSIDAGQDHQCWSCMGEPPDGWDDLCPVGQALASGETGVVRDA
jgi:hypothetical protein